jgi:hypothetical protein
MPLSETLRDYVAAAFAGIWVQSHEPDEALKEIAACCRHEKWTLAAWDVDRGLQVPGQPEATPALGGTTDPLAAVRALSAMASQDGTALLALIHFHRFIGTPEMTQALVHQIQQGKRTRTFVVVIAPVVQIPVELEKLFVVLEHELPDRQQLRKIAEGLVTESGDLPSDDAELDKLLDAAAGLTRYEAEGALSLSLVRENRLAVETIWEIKSGMLKKSGLLALHRGGERFNDLGGLDAIKQFCTRALRPRPATDTTTSVARPRGVMLLSPPGCGKSVFARSLGNETQRPTLILDVGSLMGSLVGATEANVRQALRIADAMAPSILFIDEVEKALAGAASSGQSDSGVSARLFGTILTWLSDHSSDVFVVCTANDVSKLPPEFSRAERFDGVFFLDLPGTAEKDAIWPIYLRRYRLEDQQDRRPADKDWTGAEIASCCRLAALLDVPLKEAAKQVVPVAATASETVEKLRTWATGRCLDASHGGIYCREGTVEGPKVSRKITRPSNN